jgi:hypothetical protein
MIGQALSAAIERANDADLRNWVFRAHEALIELHDLLAADTPRNGAALLAMQVPALVGPEAFRVGVATVNLSEQALAFALAEAAGEDPHHLLWEGQPPEPWGEVWQRYLSQARAVIAGLAKRRRASTAQPQQAAEAIAA